MILIHEFGHFVIGLAVRDSFQSIRVGVIKFDRFDKLKWDSEWGSLFSGATLTFPTMRTGQRWRLFLSTLAGPVSTVMTGFLAFKLASTISPGSNVMLSSSLYAFSAESFFAALVNLVPAVLRGHMNDGMRLLALAFSRKRSERLISILLFLADAKRGNGAALDKYGIGKWAIVNDQTGDQVIANWVAYRESKDQVEVAAQYLESCLAHCSATTHELREEFIIEAATFQAHRRNRVDLARAWLSEDRSGKKRVNRYFVEAVILHQEGKLKEAVAKIDEALGYIATTTDSSLRSKQEGAFKRWKNDLEEKSGDKNAVETETS